MIAPRWVAAILLAVSLAASASAQDAAVLGKLPDVHALTALKSGDWDDLGDLIDEALNEAEDLAGDYDLKLTENAVIIYEMFGLKRFRARIGYLIDPQAKAKPRRFGKGVELQRLAGPAYVATGAGGFKAAIPIRRKVLDEIEKPGVRRLKGVETIEIFYGDLDGKETRIEVYGPLR